MALCKLFVYSFYAYKPQQLQLTRFSLHVYFYRLTSQPGRQVTCTTGKSTAVDESMLPEGHSDVATLELPQEHLQEKTQECLR